MKSRLSFSALAAGALLAIGLAGPAAAAGLDLSRYSLTSTFALPTGTASESSAITLNWDSNGQFVTVKEKSPQAVQFGSVDFDNGAHTMTSLFTPNLGVLDLSDVQVLPGSGNLLIFSQESSRLLEVSRSGVVLSSLDFSALSGSTEGVTITAGWLARRRAA